MAEDSIDSITHSNLVGNVEYNILSDNNSENYSENDSNIENKSNKIELERIEGMRHRRKSKSSVSTKFYGETESQQYEQDEFEVYKRHQKERHYDDKNRWWSFSQKAEVWRWFLTFVTGLFCGIVAIFVTFCTQLLTRYKYEYFYELVEKEKLEEIVFGSSFIFLLSFNLGLAFLAWTTVFIEPLAGGSGIPEVKCFLNGLNIHRLVKFKTLFCKAVGIVFACSSGLPLGKEGPMVHAGAVVAAEVSQEVSGFFGFFQAGSSFSKNQDFRNDKEKRDFVACGAAAGVAAAFGSPIGGVLFALEEGSSFWSTKLTWRCFFCAMTTVFTLFIINSARTLFGHSDNTAMFSFGEFFSLKGEKSNYAVWELFLFIYVGCLGGLIGALFNKFNSYLSKWRSSRKTCVTFVKLSEVLIVTAIMTSIAYFVPYYLGQKCTPLPVDMEEWSEQEKRLVDHLVPFYCPKGTHYNELASLFLTDSDTAIKQLFHFREIGDHNDSTFSSFSLVLFFSAFLSMSCITNGLAVPAGMFVPSLLSGAAFGRLTGHLLHKLDMARGTFADSGTYALMGAASITSGITRMTISLTVMILEGTGDMQYVLPLMLTVMTARLIGNIFTEGLYDMYIHNRDLNFLDEDDCTQLSDLVDISVTAIMTKNPICMPPIIQVGEVYDIISKCSHHCFPIVLQNKGNIFGGTITRKAICSIIKNKAYAMNPFKRADGGSGDSSDIYFIGGNSNQNNQSIDDLFDDPNVVFPQINYETLECDYPSYPNVSDLSVSDAERSAYIDLRPYIDLAAYQLNEHASIQRAYRMFRTLGLRHLIVCDQFNKVIGILSRADLVASHIYSRSMRLFNSLNSKAKSTSGAAESMSPIHSLLRSMSNRSSPSKSPGSSGQSSPRYASLNTTDSQESFEDSDQVELLEMAKKSPYSR